MKPTPISALTAALAFIYLASCKAPSPDESLMMEAAENALPPISKQFACLPDEAALIAAHRGTSKNTAYPENASGSLEALINEGILVAEVDVAGLRDGTHILFHDGVWDDKTTGKGPVASTRWPNARRYLLKDTRGNLSGEIPPKLTDILAQAKNRIYLEIDFKSSAKYDVVIDAINEAGMGDQVILIAYTAGQAQKLAELAPNMMISVTVKSMQDIKAFNSIGLETKNIAAWLGRSNVSSLTRDLKTAEIPILRMGPEDRMKVAAKLADLLVTDYAFNHGPYVGLDDNETAQKYWDCLKTD